MKELLKIVLTISTALITILILVRMAPDLNSRKNGFVRKFISPPPLLIGSAFCDPGCKYISGVSSSCVYFSTFRPGELKYYNFKLGVFQLNQFIKDRDLLKKIRISNMVMVDSPIVYLFNGAIRLIIKTDLQEKERIVKYLPELYTHAYPVSASSIIVRKFKRGVKDQCLYKYDMNEDSLLNEQRTTTVDTDGGLSTDGNLLFDGAMNRCIYIEHSSNKITLLDTNLHIVKVGHTIDTFSHNIFQPVEIPKGRISQITNNGPLQFINVDAFSNDGLLYVYSGVRSDDQSDSDFSDWVTIDLYDEGTIQYMGSYKIIKPTRGKVRNFWVRGDHLYLYISHELQIYTLPKIPFPVL